jgi:hypothetical protein
VNFGKNLYLLRNGEEKEIRVLVKSMHTNLKGTVRIVSEKGWNIFPESYDFSFNNKNEEKEFNYKIKSTDSNSSAIIKAQVEIGGKLFTKGLETIDYPHIQAQTILFEASSKVLKLNSTNGNIKKIAYIMGSGDKIPELLKDLGYSVDVFTGEPLTTELLKTYDVVIAGIRAYNTYQRLASDHKNILKYVEDGGTFIVQYNTTGDLVSDPSPYKMQISRDRVTEEDSPVSIINPNHYLMNYPFKITQNDFDGWVQERGLYFPNEWDEKFIPLIEMNDKGETGKTGSLLVAKYGEGIFIYTGLSFFRQLPAGVEGAYKLFINLLSAGINE